MECKNFVISPNLVKRVSSLHSGKVLLYPQFGTLSHAGGKCYVDSKIANMLEYELPCDISHLIARFTTLLSIDESKALCIVNLLQDYGIIIEE